MKVRRYRGGSAGKPFLTSVVVGLLMAGLAAGERPARISDEATPCLDVRAEPSYRAEVVGCVDAGSEVSVSEDEDGWSRLETAAGLSGWAGSRFLAAVQSEAPTTEPLIRIEPADLTPYQAPVSEEASSELAQQRDELGVRLARALRRIEDLETQLADAARQNLDGDLLRRTTLERDVAQAELGAERQRVADLEGQVEAIRTASQEALDAHGGLSTQIQELQAERDRLNRQLAQAEARQLYLQTDLERTRAELMQLKGVPPRIVRDEPEPRPQVAAPQQPEPPVETAPTPEVEPAAELPTLPDFFGTDEIVYTVRAWAQAWSEQRADDYLAFYSSSFVPPDGMSREEWEALRRERVLGPRSIQVTLEQLTPVLAGNRGIVTFRQSYVSDTFNDQVTKTLVLERADGMWRIVDERAEE